MMKNPPSMQVNLDALAATPERVLIAVDEGTPDPSWIYGTDFSKLTRVDVITGTKCWQFATRLAYEGIAIDAVIPDLKPALERFIELPSPVGPEDPHRQLRADDADPQAARLPRDGGGAVITIVHLYPRELGINGDVGNVTALRRRAEWRGMPVEVVDVGPGDALPEDGPPGPHRQRAGVIASPAARRHRSATRPPCRHGRQTVCRSWPSPRAGSCSGAR